nr:MAG TPA: hypothetical protein [Caudoviricetes sp.]
MFYLFMIHSYFLSIFLGAVLSLDYFKYSLFWVSS